MARSKVGDSGLEIVVNIVRRRMWAGLIAFVTAFSLAAPFSVFLPNVYKGTATVIVESQEQSTYVRASVPELETRLVTIQQELLSRARLSNLIRRLNLYPRSRGKVPHDAIVDLLRRDIHIEFTGTDQTKGRPTTIGVKISYIGLDAKSAAEVPNAVATLYVEENTKLRERQTGKMAEFLKGQLDATKQTLNSREAGLNDYKRTHSGELPEQTPLNMVAVERLNSELRMNTDNQAKIRHDRATDVTSNTAEPPDELTVLKQKLRDLEIKFTDKHPEVIQTRAQISELEKQRAADGNVATPRTSRRVSADPGADAELAALQRDERRIRDEVAAYNVKIQMAPAHAQELEALERDYKTAKETYDSLRGRYEEAQLADSLEQTKTGESFRVLDTAVVPSGPAAPNRLRLLIMAGMFATAAAIGAMLLTEHLDTSFHSVGELRQFTSVPVLATIPYLRTPTNVLKGAVRFALVAAAVVCVCVVMVGAARHFARGNTQLVWMLSGPRS